MIQDRLNLTYQELTNIFEPINQTLIRSKSRGEKGLFNNTKDIKRLNDFFLPIIEYSSSISSLMIATDLGDEYMLLKTDSVWINRVTRNGSRNELPTEYYWEENKERHQELIKTTVASKPYDPRQRPWFQLAINNPNDSIANWTSPYTFFTTGQPGITASIKWKDETSGISYCMGLDVLIADISEFTANIDVTDHGKVFVLTEEGEVIGLPKDEQFNSRKLRNEFAIKKMSELDIPLLKKATEAYERRENVNNYIPFSFDKMNWWLGIEKFNLGKEKELLIGVIVPETDFSEDIEYTRRLIVGGLALIALFFMIIIYTFFRMKRANKIIALEKEKNEQLLLNTLPIKVVNDLKANGKSDPQKFKNVTVCFADIVGFTKISSILDPKLLINELNNIYTAFDEVMVKYDCERIKTIGDAYLAVCGMPQKNERHAEMMLKAALDILAYIKNRNNASQLKWQMRIGIHSGNVVGGIVGIKKYIYDVFGDTINTASRMEGNSQPMRVNISEETFRLVKDSKFVQEYNISFEHRDPIEVKGKGLMNMYFAIQHNS